MFSRLEGEAKSLLSEIIELSYFMRGSVSYNEMMDKTFIERQLINDFLNTRLEQEALKLNPNY